MLHFSLVPYSEVAHAALNPLEVRRREAPRHQHQVAPYRGVLGFQPRRDREIRASRQQKFGGLLRIVRPAVVLVDNSEVDQAKAGTSSVKGFESGNRFLSLPSQAVGSPREPR